MNKSLVYFLIFFAFISCKAEEEKIFLNVEKSYVSFTSASGTERIPVNTNSAFNASSPADWCSVKTSENQLTISVEENKNSQERTAKIVVGAEKVQDFLIEVHQEGTAPFFRMEQEQQTQLFESDNESRLLKVNTNIPFTATSGQSWCKTEILQGATNNLRITVEENANITSRETEVTIAAEGFESLVVSVEQNGSLPNKQGMFIKGWVYSNNTGVPDVVVSDGYEVTVTDANGVYYLPSKKQNNYVFISVPGNYEATNIGSAPQFYKKLNEKANVIERHDFELIPVDNSKHVVLTMADLHLANRVNDIFQFEKCLDDINEVIAAYEAAGTKVYGLTLGDITWDTYWYSNNFTPTEYVPFMNRINAPVYNTIGNHDHDPYCAGDKAAQQFYINVLGPNYYSFNLGDIHYVVLDDIDYINTGGSQGVSGSRNYNNYITSEQIDWLKKDLELVKDKNAPLIIAMHSPLFKMPDINNSFSFYITNGGALVDCLSGFSNVHVITGHVHTNYTYVYSDALMEHNTAAICATWWWTGNTGYAANHICRDGSVGGYGVWEMDGKNAEWYYKSVGYERNYQFRTYDLNSVEITAAKYAPLANATSAAQMPEFAGEFATAGTKNEILINIWNWDEDWTISVKEEGVELPVRQVMAKDPLHIISYEAKRLNLNASVSTTFATRSVSHMFKATASKPASTLYIDVTDRFGNVYSETMIRPKNLTTNMK